MVSCVKTLNHNCSFSYYVQIEPNFSILLFCALFFFFLISLRLFAFRVVSSLGAGITITSVECLRKLDLSLMLLKHKLLKFYSIQLWRVNYSTIRKGKTKKIFTAPFMVWKLGVEFE